MKTYRHELVFNLPTRRGFVNITAKVQDCVKESHVIEGLVLVNSMHISSSIFINDHESGLLEDWGQSRRSLPKAVSSRRPLWERPRWLESQEICDRRKRLIFWEF